LSIVNFDLVWLLPVGCYVQIGFYGKLLLSTILPVVLVLVLFTPRIISLMMVPCNQQLTSTWKERLGVGSGNDVRMLLVFTFWIFPGVSTTVLQTFACEPFATGESFLRADYSVQCYTASHKLYIMYAGFMTALYPFGIPLLYAAVLHRERRLAWQTQHAAVSYAPPTDKLASSDFLWEPYRPKVFYWEVLECMRRLLLTGLLAFILPGTAGQSAVACTLAFFTILIYCFVHPHKSRADTVGYTLSAAIIFVTMFASLLTQAEYTDNESEHVISLLLIVLNV
jgi:hypothetical protein